MELAQPWFPFPASVFILSYNLHLPFSVFHLGSVSIHTGRTLGRVLLPVGSEVTLLALTSRVLSLNTRLSFLSLLRQSVGSPGVTVLVSAHGDAGGKLEKAVSGTVGLLCFRP